MLYKPVARGHSPLPTLAKCLKGWKNGQDDPFALSAKIYLFVEECKCLANNFSLIGFAHVGASLFVKKKFFFDKEHQENCEVYQCFFWKISFRKDSKIRVIAVLVYIIHSL